MSDRLSGRTLGKYRIEALLGRGGMAEVYRAYQPNLDRDVAIKVMQTSIADQPDAVQRFETEARSIAKLRHDHIIPIFDYDIDPEMGQPYMVMEYLSGGSLQDVVQDHDGRPMDVSKVQQIIREVGSALAYAHKCGVLHRDVKPGNVLRNAEGRFILTDFGLAQLLSNALISQAEVMGTPAYMPPEQVMGLPLDGRADLYALGVMAFQLFTGQLPFEADSAFALALKHVNEDLPNPRSVNPALPESVSEVLVRCLAKQPASRYDTVTDFLTMLDAACAQVGTQRIGPFTTAAAPDLTTPLIVTGRTPASIGLEIPAPPEPALPPRLINFIGREAELARYERELTERHLAVIAGMMGMGKTSLAVALLQRLNKPQLTFWHAFKAGEGVNVLIWRLAAFLAWKGQPDLWKTLQSNVQTGSPLPPPEVLLDYAFHMVRGQGFCLAFDDFHLVDTDPLLSEFVARLESALSAGELDVVITAQRRPDFVPDSALLPLGGLTLPELAAWANQQAIVLEPAQIAELHALTGGNAALVMLALDALSRERQPARLLKRLGESHQVERFLIKEVDAGLSDDEREMMKGLAVLQGYPGTREALSALLDGKSVRRTLNDLAGRYLLIVIDGEQGVEYVQHALVQGFYYDLLDKRERQTMHQRAGEYYELDEPDVFKAAQHFQLAGEYERSARLATADVWALIDQGLGGALQQILDRFAARQLPLPLWAEVNLTRGRIHALLGHPATARTAYETALDLAESLPDAAALIARTCLGLGELLMYDVPREALTWVQRGLEVGGGTTAALLIRLGAIQDLLGQSDAALESLNKGLVLLPPGPSRLRATALNNLGVIYAVRGQVDLAEQHYQQALRVYQKLNNFWGIMDVWHNLAYELDVAGRWAEAVKYYEQEMELAQKLGSVAQRFQACLGLGVLETKRGDDAAAEKYLNTGLEVVRQLGSAAYLSYILPVLAGVYLNHDRLAEAEELLKEAEELVEQTGGREPLPEIYRNRARLGLSRQNFAAALADGERSIAVAVELQMGVEEGMSRRVRGEALWLNQQYTEALASFEQSLALLTGRDPYEAARTQLMWGRAWLNHNPERARELLREAQATFEKLGAQREAAQCEALDTA